jgi:hypothetical protein
MGREIVDAVPKRPMRHILLSATVSSQAIRAKSEIDMKRQVAAASIEWAIDFVT